MNQRKELKRIRRMKRERNANLKELTKDSGMHYVGRTPTKPRNGWVLAHNHVRHTVNMGILRNGFRAWWFTKSVPDDFKPCHCGWSKLPHVSVHNDYKCEPEEVIAGLIEPVRASPLPS